MLCVRDSEVWGLHVEPCSLAGGSFRGPIILDFATGKVYRESSPTFQPSSFHTQLNTGTEAIAFSEGDCSETQRLKEKEGGFRYGMLQ